MQGYYEVDQMQLKKIHYRLLHFGEKIIFAVLMASTYVKYTVYTYIEWPCKLQPWYGDGSIVFIVLEYD